MPGEAAAHLFQVISRRYEHGSIILTTNRGIASRRRWGILTIATGEFSRSLTVSPRCGGPWGATRPPERLSGGQKRRAAPKTAARAGTRLSCRPLRPLTPSPGPRLTPSRPTSNLVPRSASRRHDPRPLLRRPCLPLLPLAARPRQLIHQPFLSARCSPPPPVSRRLPPCSSRYLHIPIHFVRFSALTLLSACLFAVRLSPISAPALSRLVADHTPWLPCMVGGCGQAQSSRVMWCSCSSGAAQAASAAWSSCSLSLGREMIGSVTASRIRRMDSSER